MKIADHVSARKPRRKTADTNPKILFTTALRKMNPVAPVKIDITIRTGNKITFNGIRIGFGNDIFYTSFGLDAVGL